MKERIELVLKQPRLIGITFLLGTSALSFAQEKIEITGHILGREGQPVPYASVRYAHLDNRLGSDAGLTDEKGFYRLNILPGKFNIEIEAIGYKKQLIKKIIGSIGGDLGIINLQSETTHLSQATREIEGVVLKAKAPAPYKIELDKKVYNVDQDLTAKGGTLQDVLANVPSVNIESDGSVSLRGNGNVTFLIDGKPSSILGITDDANALQSIPADQIDRIETITNPSARYEAGGTAGILNIILKKNKATGFQGSAEGTLGHQPMSRLNVNLGWRRGKWNWFTNGGGGYSDIETLSTIRTFFKKNPRTEYLENRSRGQSKNYTFNGGGSYNATDRFSLNASLTLNGNTSQNFQNVDIFNTYSQENTTPLVLRYPANALRISDGTGSNNTLQLDAGFDWKLDNKGQILTFSSSYQDTHNDSRSTATDYNFPGGRTTIFQNLSSVGQRTGLLKLDYELPIKENSKLEAGARYDHRNNKTDNEYTNLSAGIIDPTATNTIDYLERISALYTQFRSKVGGFGYQIGLRNENTNIAISYLDGNQQKSNVFKSYSGLFPSLFLSYDLDKYGQFNLNFARRINRPRSWQLLPVVRIQNQTNRFQGNADLNPSYTHSFEMGYNYSKGRWTLSPTIYYQRTTDDVNVVQQNINIDGQAVIVSTPMNIGTEDRLGAELNYNINPFSWFRVFGNLNVFKYTYQSPINETQGISAQFRASLSFKFNKNIAAQLQGNYTAAERTFINERLPIYFTSIGISKTIMDGDATFNLNIQDIFNTRRRRINVITDAFQREIYMQRMPRMITLSFSYRFRNKEFGKDKNRQMQKVEREDRDTGRDDMGMGF